MAVSHLEEKVGQLEDYRVCLVEMKKGKREKEMAQKAKARDLRNKEQRKDRYQKKKIIEDLTAGSCPETLASCVADVLVRNGTKFWQSATYDTELQSTDSDQLTLPRCLTTTDSQKMTRFHTECEQARHHCTAQCAKLREKMGQKTKEKNATHAVTGLERSAYFMPNESSRLRIRRSRTCACRAARFSSTRKLSPSTCPSSRFRFTACQAS